VHDRTIQFNAINGYDSLKFVPSEMLFASASGLDPHISAGAAVLQVDRIAGSRSLDNQERMKLMNIIKELTETPQFGFLGNERINVLALNIELDKLDESQTGIR
jgi:K+-transporting ATPase ATPase C chain